MIKLIILVFLINCIGKSTAVTISSSHEDTVYEGGDAFFYFDVTNDEIYLLTITTDHWNERWESKTTPDVLNLDPGQSGRITFRIINCSDIDEDLRLTPWVFFDIQRTTLWGSDAGSGVDNHTVILYVINLNDEDISSPDRSAEADYYPIIAIGTLGILILIFCYRYTWDVPFGIVAPFYYKLTEDDLRTNQIRQTILQYLGEQRGARTSDICEDLNLNRSTVNYHLRKLCEYGMIIRGRDRRFYIPTDSNQIQYESIDQLIENMLIEDQEVKKAEIARRLNISRQHLNYHLRKMDRRY